MTETRKSSDPAKEIERRCFAVTELRADAGGKLVGHAAVFNIETDLYWYREKISPGAFSASIGSDDIRALFNHDSNFVLGRNRSGTLTLREDDKGLAVEIAPPDVQWARDLVTTIKRGDVSQMSFAFRTITESWKYADVNGQMDVRTLEKVQLFDVSPVTFPAYHETDVAVHSRDRYLAEQRGANSGRNAAAAMRLRMAELALGAM